MSNRKENIYNRPNSLKRPPIAQNDHQRSRCVSINLNSTFANLPSSHQKLKAETTFLHTPVVDYDLSYDLAESNYLQALLFQKYTWKQSEKHALSLNDQLSKYTEVLSRRLEIMTKLECDINEREIQDFLQIHLCNLEEKLDRNLKELSENVLFVFVKILKKLESACANLYLNKVKPLKNQEEYDKLQALITKCEKILIKIINSSSDIDKYQKLNVCLSQFKNMENEITTTDNSVKTLEGDVNKLTLETVSDLLFEVDVNKNVL